MTRQIVCFVFACLAGSATLAEPFTAEHLVLIDRVGAPAVSPDGELIVYAVRHTDMEADKGRYDLWLSSIDGGEPRRLTTHEANDTSPAWSTGLAPARDRRRGGARDRPPHRRRYIPGRTRR